MANLPSFLSYDRQTAGAGYDIMPIIHSPIFVWDPGLGWARDKHRDMTFD